MRIAIAAGLGLAATAASAAIVLPLPAPDPVAPRVAAPPPPAQDEEPIEVEVLRPWPVESEEPPPWELRSIPQLPMFPTEPEVRDARLALRLVDAETGRPVAMAVRLWRLGVPEDDRWTEGDAEIETVAVAEEGTAVRDLVPGRYRLHADGQRKDAPDPPEFEIESGDNETVPSVYLARTLALRVRVFGEDGVPVERGSLRILGFCSYRRPESRPKWARSRAEKLPDGSFRIAGRAGGSRGCNPGGDPATAIAADPEGFDLGSWTEERRNSRQSWGVVLEFEGRGSVRCGVGGGTGFTGILVAPAPSRERLLRGVLLEDGGTALDRGATVEARADARWLREGEPEDLWKSVPVRVKASLDGYFPIEFEVRLDESDAETTRTMEIARVVSK